MKKRKKNAEKDHQYSTNIHQNLRNVEKEEHNLTNMEKDHQHSRSIEKDEQNMSAHKKSTEKDYQQSTNIDQYLSNLTNMEKDYQRSRSVEKDKQNMAANKKEDIGSEMVKGIELNHIENVELELSLTRAEVKAMADQNTALKAQLEKLRRELTSPARAMAPSQSTSSLTRAEIKAMTDKNTILKAQTTQQLTSPARATVPSQSTAELTIEAISSRPKIIQQPRRWARAECGGREGHGNCGGRGGRGGLNHIRQNIFNIY
ncbi:uncharacterized protein LOC115237470 [Formica exsecta]|uniref:uncharacterized protein LOC115237470 n=1 Tax=Formica exsecta TaxID=72781 RepID=UPI00114166FA|nr:uncharacterized protein LOC115237470 [Formica exsecta]